MSQSDSFIEEVTEEVRRDRLFAFGRKYGWIAVLAVFLVVGGAGFNEWRKAQATAKAQALGDAIYQALERDSSLSRLSALEGIPAEGAAEALVALLAAGEAAPVDAKRAGDLLETVIANAALPQIYRDLATLKLTMLADYPMMSDQRIARLEPLTAPGAPLRLVALEQKALLHLERRENDMAQELLSEVIEDAGTSAAQRQRAQQILIVLGGGGGA
ncbi:MAG: hypothetical protein KDA50_12330 [Rhodobacteraceae bacterium]|nr:hypothetical protein [Paracoccaceae bacterium]